MANATIGWVAHLERRLRLLNRLVPWHRLLSRLLRIAASRGTRGPLAPLAGSLVPSRSRSESNDAVTAPWLAGGEEVVWAPSKATP
jgi:hypothetical protein